MSARLNGVTSYLYNPYLIQKAVSYLWLSAICILQRATEILSFVNHFAFPIQLSISWISGKGQRSFFMIEFSAQQSTQNQSLLPGFYTNRTGAASDEWLTWVKFLSSKSTSILQRTTSSSYIILQNSLQSTSGSLPLGHTRLISWLIPFSQYGGSWLAFLSWNISKNS